MINFRPDEVHRKRTFNMAEKSWLDSNPERTQRRDECMKVIDAGIEAGAAMATTDLPCEGRIQGKVRDIYTLPNDNLLLVATDRQSAFDRSVCL